jgi:diphthine-ammonia ligase
MDVVALLSGGKDSCFNACHAVRQGHRLVALATLSPEDGIGTPFCSQIFTSHPGADELDSYLYQTVGQDGITFIAQAMELPLYRRTIRGTAVDQSLDYTSAGSHTADETEDLGLLLQQVLQAHPSIQAVSVGAILSNYQRTRVEHVCVACSALAMHSNRSRKAAPAWA